jgi:DNA-binding transcriptional LysR family regulator
LDLRKISIFQAVVAKGGFAAAARHLQLEPSVVTRTIQILEEEWGVLLFQRTTRKVSLTESGERLYARAEALLEEWSALKEEVRGVNAKPEGKLRITSPVSFGVEYLPSLVEKFLRKYPDVKCDLLVSDEMKDLISDKIDIAIRFGHLPDSSFMAHRLARLEYHVCASPRYLNAHGQPPSPAEVGAHRCLQMLIAGFPDAWKFKKKGGAQTNTVAIPSPVRTSSVLCLKEMACQGLGLALLPQILAHVSRQSLNCILT